jgi:hypothetical protein
VIFSGNWRGFFNAIWSTGSAREGRPLGVSEPGHGRRHETLIADTGVDAFRELVGRPGGVSQNRSFLRPRDAANKR